MFFEELFDVNLTVVQYEHIDDFDNFLDPKEVLPLSSESLTLLEKVKETFKKSGWEGDGNIGLVWIPSFFYIPPPNTSTGQMFGTYIWHVKQHNNGTSFLGFYPEGLSFISKNSLLALQNDRLFDDEE